MNRLVTAIVGIAALLGGTASAQQGLIDERPASQTDLWLALQREGNLAPTQVQTATPSERELALQRLLESFSHPIPEFFDQDAGGQVRQ